MTSLLFHLMLMNLKTVLALRGAFLLRLFFTLINHSVYLTVWVMFFRQVDSVGGWGYPHLMLAYGIGLWAWGVTSFFTFGIRILPRLIDEGALDNLLLQPKPILFLLATNHHEPAGLADIILGTIFIAIAGCWMPLHLSLLICGVLCACVTFASFCLAVGSAAFWWHDVQDWATDLYFNTFIFATRPASAFRGEIRLLMFTVLPVGYMTLLPVEMQINGNAALLIPLLAGTAACTFSAYFLFNLGLKRYASGNRFTVRS